MEVLYLKSQGIKHKEICSLCQISKTILTIYIKQYQLGGVEELVLDNAKYQKCKLVQDYAKQLDIQL